MTTSAVGNRLADLNFFPLESIRLHRVTGLEGFVALERDPALLARGHLPDVLLEVLQRADPALEDLLLAPQELDPASTADLALQHSAARDDAQARDLDRRDDLDLALANLTVRRLAQPLGRALDVLRQLVDDVVVAHLDLGPFRRGGRGGRRLEVEAHDDRV